MKRQLSEEVCEEESLSSVQTESEIESKNDAKGKKQPKFEIPFLDYDHFDQNFNHVGPNMGLIGEGGFGKVFKVRHKLNYKLFAIKRIALETPLDPDLIDRVTREVKILKEMSGRFVVNYENSWIQNKDCLYIQMELCSDNLQKIIGQKQLCFGRRGGSTKDMNQLEFLITSNLFKDLLECVKYLHESTPVIIHRDLKPANVLIVEKPNGGCFLKLCDFGLAKGSQLNTQTHTRGQGSPGYMALELMAGSRYNFKVDIFSLGRIALDLFEYSINNPNTPNKYIELKSKWRELKSIIKNMNSITSKERPTCAQIIKNFNKWGISGNDLEKFGITHNDLDILSNHPNKFFEKYFQEKIKALPPNTTQSEVTHKTQMKITDYFPRK